MNPERPRYRWLVRLLDRPRADLYIICLSALLLSTGLGTGLAADDYVHKLSISGSGALPGFDRSPLDIYRFATAESVLLWKQQGVVPWWDDPEARLAFFRPLSALTHYLDHVLWPDSAFLMHLHCLLWGLVVFAGMRALCRALLPGTWAASLALLLYALDDSRAWFTSWVAARNATVATAVSIWALVFFVRYRKQSWKPGAWLGPLMLTLGLLAGEGSIAICGYLLAYALFMETDSPARRLMRLAPYALAVVIWRVAYRALDYSVSGSGLYVDPTAEPGRFLLAFVERAPILLYAQWGGFWSDLWSTLFIFPRLKVAVMFTAVLFLAALLWLLLPLLRRDPLVRFSLAGSLLAVVPASATFTSDRLLSWVAIGASLALARLLALYVEQPQRLGLGPVLGRAAPALVLALVVVNVILAPPLLASRARGNDSMRSILDRANAGIPADSSITGKTVVLVNPPGVPMASYIPIERAVKGVPRPRAMRWLAISTTEVELQRLDKRTLRVRPRGGFLISPADTLLRSPSRPLKSGQQFDLGDMTVRVNEMTADHKPAEITARFSVPLEHGSLCWRCWVQFGYTSCAPPAIGETVRLPAADYFEVVFGIPLPISGRLEPEPEKTARE